MNQSFFAVAAIGAILGLAPARAAEPAAQVNGVRLTKYIIGVSDLDRSYAFYHALGVELQGSQGIRKPAALPDPIRGLVDVPSGTKFRNAMLTIPGADFALEMTEFSSLDLRP